MHLKVGSSLAELNLKDEEKEKQSVDLAYRMESLIDSFRLWNMEEDSRGFVEFAKEVLLTEKYINESESSTDKASSENKDNNNENNSQTNLIDFNSCNVSNNLNTTAQIFEMTATENLSVNVTAKTLNVENNINESIIIDSTEECLPIMKESNLIKTEIIDENNNLN